MRVESDRLVSATVDLGLDLEQLARQASVLYQNHLRLYGEGKPAEAGKSLEQLGAVINEIVNKSQKK
jgi:hypothetical protein